MLKIYIARHGQDQDNAAGILNGHRDNPLTDIGIKQAEELAKKIQSLSIVFDKVYSSPLKRAHKTAEIICVKLGLDKLEVLNNLIERNFGEITGKLVSDIPKMCAPDIIKGEIATYCISPKDGENFPQLVERAKQLLKELSSKHKDGNILLVTHGDFGKMLYTAFYNLDWRDILAGFHFGNSELLELASTTNPENAKVISQQQYNH